MCGRYTLKAPVEDLLDLFHLVEAAALPARYNIAPTQPVPAVRMAADKKGRELAMFRWGLIPGWAKDLAIGNRLINGRSETAAEKPAFRSAFRKRRCLMPADGFYEWKKEGGKKQPFYIQLKNGRPFAFAGLWEDWQDEQGKRIQSCTILTTDANDLVRPIHDRMPVILESKDFDKWLDPDIQQPEMLLPILRPYSGQEMTAYPVSTVVNNPRNENPKCIEPVA
jgi:putative SOS response-associated peptidase YedK